MVAVITTVGVPVEEALDDIGMKAINMVIHMEFDSDSSWVISLRKVWPTQSLDKWVNWLNNPSSGEEVPNIEWLTAVFPGTNRNYGRPDPGIKSWSWPMKSLRDVLKKSCNLKLSLVFSPYHWSDGLK